MRLGCKARHSGAAREHSDIKLMLFSNDEKPCSCILLKHYLEIEKLEWIVRIRGHEKTVAELRLGWLNNFSHWVTRIPKRYRPLPSQMAYIHHLNSKVIVAPIVHDTGSAEWMPGCRNIE